MLQNSKVSKDLILLDSAPKVLFYVSRYWPSIAGASLYTRELIHRLSDLYDIGVLRHSGDDPFNKEIAFVRNPTLTLTDGRTPIYQVGAPSSLRWLMKPLANMYQSNRWSRPFYNFLLRLGLAKQISDISQPYHIIHAVYTGMTASVSIAQRVARRQRKPFVLTPLPDIRSSSNRVAKSLRRLYVNSDALIARSPFEKEWLVGQGVERSKIYICPYGPLVNSSPKPREFRSRHGLGHSPMVLFIGPQTPEKGYHSLLLATSKVWQRYPDTRFCFIGSTNTTSLTFFKELDDARILNLSEVSAKDRSSALAACNIFCVPSLQDNLGVSYLEAWEFEKPVIGADIPVISSLIDHDINGLVVQPSSVAIANGIIKLLANPKLCQEMGSDGFRKVRKFYDWQFLTHQMGQIYSELSLEFHGIQSQCF